MERKPEVQNTVQMHITPNYDSIFTSEDLFCYKQKRKGVVWSKEEIDLLKEGINKHGKGRWTKILNEFKDDFDENRRNRDLSDKLRLLEKTTSYRKRLKMEYWEVDENNEPIYSKMGEPIKYFCKFPYEAAYRCACTKNFKSGEAKIIICYEEANKKWYHTYCAQYVRNGNKRVQVRKMAGSSVYRSDGM